MSSENSCADECLLVEYLEKATNSTGFWDSMAIKLFCMLVKNNEELIGKAHELLILKMYSQNVPEALKAIEVLQECMMVCGSTFQKKTAKFKFLNKLIEIVDEQRSSTVVSVEVRKRIMECFLLWTVEYPDKVKIRECYEDLKKKVTFDHKTSVVKVPQRSKVESILGKDEALMRKLLHEGGPENLLAANLLIKNRVQLKDKHDEMLLEHNNKLREIDNSLEVLNEMIDNYCAGDNTDTLNLLFSRCLEYKSQLKQICDLNLFSDKQIIEETKCSYDMLLKCLDRYSRIVRRDQCFKDNNTNLSNMEKLFIEPHKDESNVSNIELLSNILIPNVQESTNFSSNEIQLIKSTAEELGELFGNTNTNKINSLNKLDFLGNLDTSESQTNIFLGNDIKNEKDFSNKIAKEQSDHDESSRSLIKGMEPIEELSEQLFKSNLNSEKRQRTFKSVPKKVTLNELVERDLDSSLTDSDVSLKKPTNYSEIAQKPLCKSLSSISIDLEKQHLPVKDQQILIDDDHVKISVQFSSVHHFQNISIIQLSVINKSFLFMNNLQFWIGVKKPCKVRLLPPTILNASKFISLRPAFQIDQTALLLNSTGDEVNLTGILHYKLDADPDSFTTPFFCTIPFKS